MQVDAILFTRQLSKHLMVAPAFKLAQMHKLNPCPHAQAPCCGREFRPACDSNCLRGPCGSNGSWCPWEQWPQTQWVPWLLRCAFHLQMA